MSKIAEQIKALQLKQKKIDYISYVADLVKNDTKCIDFQDVQKEIVEKIEPFLLKLMDSIEKDVELKADGQPALSEEQVKALALVADKLIAKPQVANQQPANPQVPPPPKPPQPTVSNQDKMNFALGNRHLADKRVQVLNDQNAQIYGKVVGLDAPHVVVKTDTGPVINVPIEKIVTL
jgi:hypothetical protein